MIGGFHYSDLFASVPGIVTAVVGTLGTVLTAIFGKFKSFKLPYESAPGLSRGFLNFVLFIPFVVCFVFVTPMNARFFLLASLLGIPVAWFSFFQFGKAFANHRYTRPVQSGWLIWKKIRDEIVVGGTQLTPAAERKHEQGEPLQKILASAEYKPDEVWERSSRTAIQLKIESFYYLFFLCAVVSIVAGALSMQALITRTAPLDAAAKIWDASHPTKQHP